MYKRQVHEGGALRNEISALIKVAQKLSCPVPHVAVMWEDGHLGCAPSPGTDSVGAMVSDIPASRTVRNKFLSFVSHLIYGTLL